MVDPKIGYSRKKTFEMDSNGLNNGYSWIFLSNQLL